VWNEGKENVIDELTDPGIVAHGLLDPQGREVKGIPEFKEFYRLFNSAFSGVRANVEFTVTEGDPDGGLPHLQRPPQRDATGHRTQRQGCESSRAW
jgi:hypothetical protein